MIKIIFKIFSIRVLSAMGLLFALSIAIATFVEYHQGVDVAWYFIYDALWFELLLAFIGLGSFVNIFASKLVARGKVGILLFHLSISVIILGSGITRFLGETGTLRIREGAGSSTLLLSDLELSVLVKNGSDTTFFDTKVIYPNRYNADFYSKNIELLNGHLLIESLSQTQTNNGVPVSQFELTQGGISKRVYVYNSIDASPMVDTLNNAIVTLSIGNKLSKLPFSIYLDSFVVQRYPGSSSPSSFISYVRVLDPKSNASFEYDIYMNHILNYGGYRFFQASYDEDEKGTILSVNHDPTGTAVTYFGYLLLVIGMLKALSDKRSRFVEHLKQAKAAPMGVILLMFVLLPSFMSASTSEDNARQFGELWVQTADGRIKPLNSFAGDLMRKISRQSEEKNRKAEETILEILKNPQESLNMDVIYKSNLGIPVLDKLPARISYNALFDGDGNYILAPVLSQIHKKQPSDRSKAENNILALDERANIFNMIRSGQLLRLFPIPDKASSSWLDLRSAASMFQSADSLTQKSVADFYINFFSDDPKDFVSALTFVQNWQEKFGSDLLPSQTYKTVELYYNRLNIFERLSRFYGLISLTFLIAAVVKRINRHKYAIRLSRIMGIHLIVASVIHGIGLLMRAYISGHMPLSNGYETMIFVSWICILIGIYFYKKSDITFALLGILASSALMVAHLSFMNPQITPLVPVLKSVWLTIHVTVITSSYAFLGGCAILALCTLFFMASLNTKNASRIAPVIRHLISINRMILIPGLYLLSIGCFLGAIWANQSWGKYWGWDPKETWCLVSVLLYSLVVHLNHLPGLKGSFFYVLGSLLSFASILMTYFGVNYFLGGMHSYAGEASVSVLPVWLTLSLISLSLLIGFSYYRYKKVLAITEC